MYLNLSECHDENNKEPNSFPKLKAYDFRVENSVDPDQMASSEACWSGSTVF